MYYRTLYSGSFINYYCDEAKKGRYFDKLFNKSANVDENKFERKIQTPLLR